MRRHATGRSTINHLDYLVWGEPLQFSGKRGRNTTHCRRKCHPTANRPDRKPKTRPPCGRLKPSQLGSGVKGGAEAAVHSAKTFLEASNTCAKPRMFVKLDVKNAFNSLDRNELLKTVRNKSSAYFVFIHQWYGTGQHSFDGL